MMGKGWRLVHAMINTCWGQRTLLLDGLILIFYIYIDPKNQIESVSRFVQKVLSFQTSLVAQCFLCLNTVLACFIVVAFHFFFTKQLASLWKYMWKMYINPIHLYYALLPSFFLQLLSHFSNGHSIISIFKINQNNYERNVYFSFCIWCICSIWLFFSYIYFPANDIFTLYGWLKLYWVYRSHFLY